LQDCGQLGIITRFFVGHIAPQAETKGLGWALRPTNGDLRYQYGSNTNSFRKHKNSEGKRTESI
jgi:hypothetical protein